RPDEKSPALCCCYGERPAASAATTTPNKSGAATPATFAAPRRCLAGTISPKRRPRRRLGSCAIFTGRASSLSHSPTCAARLRNEETQLATGVGALRKLFTAYHSSCRFLLKPWLCAVFGRMTYWRSPFGSLRKNSSRSSSVELPSHSPRVIRTGASTL